MKQPVITLMLIIFIIVLGQFWYQGFLAITKSWFGENPPWYVPFLIAVAVTVIFYILVRYVFKVPIAIFI